LEESLKWEKKDKLVGQNTAVSGFEEGGGTMTQEM
jgi:hypothetical protein